MLARAAEQESGRTPARSLEELQREGRERWLAMREARHATESALVRAPEQSIDKSSGQGRSVDEERREGIERWRECRRGQELQKGPKRGPAEEREAPEKGLDQSKERDGPELQ